MGGTDDPNPEVLPADGGASLDAGTKPTKSDGKKTSATPLPTETIPAASRTDASVTPDVDNPVTKAPKPVPSDKKPGAGATVTVELCGDTGLLATPYCPVTINKTFPAGQQPKKYCTVHRPAK